MSNLLHLLVVEDSENDTLLLLDELRKKGCEPICERVQSVSEMTAALESRVWDVVISDYVMPDFSGPAALKLLREKKFDIPFIVVSGTFGEEAAVDMMKAGANDYLVKGNLSRLVPAIEREIEAAKSRRAQAQGEAAIQFLAAIVESTDDAIYGKTLDGIIVSWNHAAERIFGYGADEIIGCSVALLFPIDRRDEMHSIRERIKRGERVGLYETERVHKEGRRIPVALTVSPIKGADNKIIGASGIARDITRRKHDEAERAKLIEKFTEALKQV
ncbi:MAG: PAS domain S-box protein, partial [Limisphaerales bacterium]